MRTILYSTERLTANNRETGLFICFLLIFALSASAYVMYHGLQVPLPLLAPLDTSRDPSLRHPVPPSHISAPLLPPTFSLLASFNLSAPH